MLKDPLDFKKHKKTSRFEFKKENAKSFFENAFSIKITNIDVYDYVVILNIRDSISLTTINEIAFSIKDTNIHIDINIMENAIQLIIDKQLFMSYLETHQDKML